MLTYLYLREFGILRPAGGVLKGSVELLSIGKVVCWHVWTIDSSIDPISCVGYMCLEKTFRQIFSSCLITFECYLSSHLP